MYRRIWSSSRPTVLTQYPRAQKLRPNTSLSFSTAPGGSGSHSCPSGTRSSWPRCTWGARSAACGCGPALPYLRTDNASLICFRQRIAQFSSSQTAGASLRLVAEVTPVGDVEAVVGCVSSAGRNRVRVPVAMRETSQNAAKTGVALADCLPRSSLASHAPDGQGGLEPPPTGVESGGSG